TGLAVGRLGDHGALARTERLAFTPAMLREAYRSPGAPEEPPFLAPSAAPPWTDDYPAELRERLPALAGYTYRDGEGYYVCAERNRYDFQAGASARGLMTARRDPLGRDTAIAYDRYGLAPVRVEDPVGLVSEAEYDYRAGQPRLRRDPNGNESRFLFGPLGFLESIVQAGRPGETRGDTAEAPSVR